MSHLHCAGNLKQGKYKVERSNDSKLSELRAFAQQNLYLRTDLAGSGKNLEDRYGIDIYLKVLVEIFEDPGGIITTLILPLYIDSRLGSVLANMVKCSLHTSQVAHQAGTSISDFCSMKRLVVFPSEYDACPSQG